MIPAPANGGGGFLQVPPHQPGRVKMGGPHKGELTVMSHEGIFSAALTRPSTSGRAWRKRNLPLPGERASNLWFMDGG